MKASVKGVTWDVAVIGGGPAGMMAAGRAAESGARVILIEKNPSLGKKLLITGGGRCNVTNAETDARVFLSKFKGSGKYLSSPFATWGTADTIAFFESRGMPTKVEAEGRVFPASNSAESVHEVLSGYLKQNKVTVHTGSAVTSLISANGMLERARLRDGSEIKARSFILATGGTSRPETGSTGDGYTWLKGLGHTVSDSTAALVPISVHDSWVKRLAGVSLKDAKITVFQNDARQEARAGKILFTHHGLSGPAILNMSRDIGELLKYGDVTLEIDLIPGLAYDKVQTALQSIFKEQNNKKLKNVLGTLVPSALIPVLLSLANVSEAKFCNAITRDERVRLMKILKHLPLRVKGLLGLDKAVITSGGVSLDEIDFTSMRSRLVPNLHIIGDLLNIDRPSGGYSLQLCWTTGRVAGENAFFTASKP